MSKTFTLSEAEGLLPVLEGLLGRAQRAGARAETFEGEMQELSHRIFMSGGMHVDIVAAARRRAEREKAIQESRDTVAEIESIGVTIEDLEDGALDFPCLVGGAMLHLCWKLGETGITHWHDAEAGCAARQTVDARFGKPQRERPN